MTADERERKREARRDYYARNKERFRERAYRWRLTNPERWKAIRQKVYQKRRSKQLADQRAKVRQVADLLAELKSVPCADCEHVFPPCCMDFDHVRGTKRKNVSWMWSNSIAAIMAEVEKCDVVCSNCHRIRTFVRRQHLWREQ